MKLEVGFDYKKQLKSLLSILANNRIVVSSAILLIIGGFVLLRINTLTDSKLDTEYRDERLKQIDSVEFDQASIDAIVELNNSSVEITSDFTDRNNPFLDN